MLCFSTICSVISAVGECIWSQVPSSDEWIQHNKHMIVGKQKATQLYVWDLHLLPGIHEAQNHLTVRGCWQKQYHTSMFSSFSFSYFHPRYLPTRTCIRIVVAKIFFFAICRGISCLPSPDDISLRNIFKEISNSVSTRQISAFHFYCSYKIPFLLWFPVHFICEPIFRPSDSFTHTIWLNKTTFFVPSCHLITTSIFLWT